MFQEILVANRGEIALRVICACKELGISTVAVYSEADRNSLHVCFADEAVCIGPARSSESYLNIPQVISAAEITNVDAIHPGYGFLSENAIYAKVCEASEITFIGPTAEVIEMRGEKDRPRREVKTAGLPTIPGSDGIVDGEEQLGKEASRIGYPLILKAVAGGGGRGMRIVRNQSELLAAYQTARSEAQQAFGNPDVYAERFLEHPRHIEFQVLGERLEEAVGEVQFSGHAIECRINAEDPDTFVPSAGRITTFQAPGGTGVRVDSAAYADAVIPPFYDSMIAKLIVKGRDRAEAIGRMKRALEMFVIEGIKTSIPLHRRIVADPDFAAGKIDTHFIERFLGANGK